MPSHFHDGIRTFTFPLEAAHYDNALTWPEVYADISTAQHVGLIEPGTLNGHLRRVPSPYFWRNRDGSFVWRSSDVPSMQVCVGVSGNDDEVWQPYWRYRHRYWDQFGVLHTVPVIGRVTDMSMLTVPWTNQNQSARLPRVNAPRNEGGAQRLSRHGLQQASQ